MHLYSLLGKLEPKDHTEQSLFLASALLKFIWTSGAPSYTTGGGLSIKNRDIMRGGAGGALGGGGGGGGSSSSSDPSGMENSSPEEDEEDPSPDPSEGPSPRKQPRGDSSDCEDAIKVNKIICYLINFDLINF